MAADEINRGKEIHRTGRDEACASGSGKSYGIQLDQYPYLPYAQTTAVIATAAVQATIAAETAGPDVRC